MKIAISALKKGVAVALEVGGAFSMEELWELVRTQENTGTPFMLMENCCFDKSELMATWMAISVLSEQSIEIGGKSVVFPDFTKGKWLIRKRNDFLR